MLLRIVTFICLAVGVAFSATSSDKTFGPYQSNIGNVEFRVTNAKQAPQILLDIVLIGGGNISPKALYQLRANEVEYVAPLLPDNSTFVVVWNDGPAYETVILAIRSHDLILKQLDARGMDYPEMVRLGAEDTQFVILRRPGSKGNVLDLADIYARIDDTYKRLQTVPYDQKLAALTRLVQKIDRDAAQRREGNVVRP